MHTVRKRYQRGSSVVEFTAAMMMFALVFMFILQGGMLAWTAVVATNAAREGARAAVAWPPDPSRCPAEAQEATPASVDLDVWPEGGGDSITCNVNADVPVLFSMFASGWPMTVSVDSTMRIER